MNAIRTKIAFAGTILLIAVAYLGFTGAKSGWVYFVDVDQYLAKQTQYQSQRIRLHGTVGTDQFEMSSTGLTARFQLAGESGRGLPVVYRGNIPEMFGVGKSVVVEGKAAADGTFEADVLMTKCASKYEPDSPHANRPGESRTEHAEAKR